MNLLSPAEVKSLLARYDIRPKKRLGQNFLIDRNVLNKILQTAELGPDSLVLEVGPGLGTVTQEAAAVAERVVTVEVDRAMVSVLEETVGDLANVEVVEADFLDLDIREFLGSRFGGRRCIVVANLPYYITTPLITRFIQAKEHVSRIVVMVQQEVADRLTAEAGSRDYGLLSVFVQYHCQVTVAARVNRTVFFPSPDVDSAIVRMDVRESPAVVVRDEGLFFRIVRAGFGQRRKTLLRALSGSPDLMWPRERAAAVLADAGIDPIRRGETLSLEEFARIAESASR